MLLNSDTPPFIAKAVSANVPRPVMIVSKAIPPEPMIRDPTTAITPSIPTRATNNADKAPTLDKALSTSLMLAKTHTNSRKTSPKVAKASIPIIAGPASILISPSIASTPTITSMRPAIDPAPARTFFASVTTYDSAAIIPVRIRTIPPSASNGPREIVAPDINLRLLIIRANTPISSAKAPADAARSFVSIKDKATTEAAIIAIATAIIIIAPLTF